MNLERALGRRIDHRAVGAARCRPRTRLRLGLGHEHHLVGGIGGRQHVGCVHAQAQRALVDGSDAESEAGILRIGRVGEVEALQGLVEVGVGVERLARLQLLPLPLDVASACGRVEVCEAVGEEICVAEVEEVLAHVLGHGQEIADATDGTGLGRGGRCRGYGRGEECDV